MFRLLFPLRTAGTLLLAAFTLNACSQSPNGSASGVDTYKEQTTTTVSVDKATGNEVRTTTTEVLTPGQPPRVIPKTDDQEKTDLSREGNDVPVVDIHSDGNGNIQASAEPADSTHVRAPFFKMDKNADTGSLHINVPFVHIDKEPGGRAHVDIGRDR